MAPVALAAVYFGQPYFEALILVGAAVALWEWRGLRLEGANPFLWALAGLAYVGLPATALIWLRADIELGQATLFWLMAVVWGTDIGAYAAGRLIGGPKLAPALSPKKTWAGLIGGMVSAGAAGAVTAHLLGDETLLPLAAFSAALAVLAQGGDLFESWLKRLSGVKDSGWLIPGHGGILDRIDGFLVVAAAAGLIQLATGGKVLQWL